MYHLIPKPGEQFQARTQGILIKQNKRINGNSEWIVTCTIGNKISLRLKKSSPNPYVCYEMTVAKSFFGENFVRMNLSSMGSGYNEPKHFYPEVNETTNKIKPVL